MEPILRKISVVVGFGLLVVSMFWSQDGFNFDLAGSSQYGMMAVIIGWFLALSVTVIQFVFSSGYKDLNASIIVFGVLAYAYSIYTNYWGILNFQGWVEGEPFRVGAALLAFVMDGVPEPMIAWGLYESLRGDFIGNLMKAMGSTPQGSKEVRQEPNPITRNTRHEQMRQGLGNGGSFPDVPPFLSNSKGGGKNGTMRR